MPGIPAAFTPPSYSPNRSKASGRCCRWRAGGPSRPCWEQYTKAKEETFARTNIPEAPWFIVEANDKKRARLNCIHHLIEQIPYEPVPHEEITLPERVFNPDYEREPLPLELDVPKRY